jgi:hypothetical protein
VLTLRVDVKPPLPLDVVSVEDSKDVEKAVKEEAGRNIELDGPEDMKVSLGVTSYYSS